MSGRMDGSVDDDKLSSLNGVIDTLGSMPGSSLFSGDGDMAGGGAPVNSASDIGTDSGKAATATPRPSSASRITECKSCGTHNTDTKRASMDGSCCKVFANHPAYMLCPDCEIFR